MNDTAATGPRLYNKSSSSYYAILNIHRSASQAELKYAYKKLARKMHPDLNIGAESPILAKNMRLLNEAYACLRNPKTRKAYDQYLQQTLTKKSETAQKEKTLKKNAINDNVSDRKKCVGSWTNGLIDTVCEIFWPFTRSESDSEYELSIIRNGQNKKAE